jgi:hypothetical protein
LNGRLHNMLQQDEESFESFSSDGGSDDSRGRSDDSTDSDGGSDDDLDGGSDDSDDSELFHGLFGYSDTDDDSDDDDSDDDDSIDDDSDDYSYDDSTYDEERSAWSVEEDDQEYTDRTWKRDQEVNLQEVNLLTEQVQDWPGLDQDETSDENETEDYNCKCLWLSDTDRVVDVDQFLCHFQERLDIQRLVVDLSHSNNLNTTCEFALELLKSDPERDWSSVTIRGNPWCHFEFLLSYLENAQCLTFVDLYNMDLNPLGQIIPRMPCLQTVRFENTSFYQLQFRGMSLNEGMARNGTVKRLLFSNCDLSTNDGDLQNDYAHELITGLSNIPHLTTLKLQSCELQDDHFCLLMNALKSLPYLAYLNVGGNLCCENKSVHAVASLLRRKRTKLIDLDISDVWDAVDLSPIFSALETNKTLKKLNVKGCYLLEEINAAHNLAQLLRNNSTLQTLDLRENGLNKKNAPVLLAAIQTNQSLECLRLEYYQFSKASMQLKFYPHLNWAGRRLLNQPVPLALWPLVLARVNRSGSDDLGLHCYHEEENVSKVLYHLLRCPDGETSTLPLAVSIAMNQPTASRRPTRRRISRACSFVRNENAQPTKRRRGVKS